MAQKYILAIDQGTTSSRAILYDLDGRPCQSAQREFPQVFPKEGWVEHDARHIWQDVRDLCRELIGGLGSGDEVVGIGITNQRETTVVWDRKTGEPIANAIVWQDRRTADRCQTLQEAGHQSWVQERTGLLLDPYFSGTKVAWLLDHVEGARVRAEAGELAFGTIDSWLIWNLTGGKVHATDATNASRTLLYNIADGRWDEELADLLEVPMGVLPEVRNCADDFGVAADDVLGANIPICGVAGDQQAATIGQTCFAPGMMKSTYGTGCFALLNTGGTQVISTNKLLTTIAYQIGGDVTYALEGSIFMAGATIQWVRDKLGILKSASESQALAEAAAADSGVFLVPAFTGLGAPYWDPHARGALIGMTRDTGIPEIARAALESVSYQTRDLMEAMMADLGEAFPAQAPLRVDGGMVANDWFLQDLANLLGRPVERPKQQETTALGAAYLAGLQLGYFNSLEDLSSAWEMDRQFEPQESSDHRDRRYERWRVAVARVLSDKN
ncbi:MAG: glycerol kinase [Alphaproteobacteria bacterium]|nr:MAG: glycerol kinase [Alphaproteobacteria bacterium]